MPAAVYAFRDSTATQAQADIRSTMESIRSFLAEIGEAIERLRPEWTADEADAYYESITKWKEGAEGINNILNDVEKALNDMQDGNSSLRDAITQVLDETS